MLVPMRGTEISPASPIRPLAGTHAQLLAPQSHQRGVDDVAGVYAGVGIQVGPVARLAKPVHAERHRPLAED